VYQQLAPFVVSSGQSAGTYQVYCANAAFLGSTPDGLIFGYWNANPVTITARKTRIKSYVCPSDPSVGNWVKNGGGDGKGVGSADISYGANFYVFGNAQQITTAPANKYLASANWAGTPAIPTTFSDGTSNTILFAERYTACGANSSVVPTYGGVWFHAGNDIGPFFAIPYFGGSLYQGSSSVVNLWQQQPNPWQTACNADLASSGHTAGIQVALGDGSVRFLANGMSQTTWSNACNPADGNVLGSDW
jgi:hypothetical protein